MTLLVHLSALPAIAGMSSLVVPDTTDGDSIEPRVKLLEEDANCSKTPPSGPSAPKMTQV
ncbi:hypothetical protein K443DRAFT_682818 [Laccaria amethystina LaAM-08-1]|uniref:Uncharacterized protein n=1 Tax=Laccaria amethystina LaAM-08-1 TaxID=1095629 RepID=A0A0C9WU53_9AGAR|nr:hypothetical protein K443DRAFT_682818 [Laccaria amethystina LaAM-08-1]